MHTAVRDMMPDLIINDVTIGTFHETRSDQYY